jgi:hypothetical protein
VVCAREVASCMPSVVTIEVLKHGWHVRNALRIVTGCVMPLRREKGSEGFLTSRSHEPDGNRDTLGILMDSNPSPGTYFKSLATVAFCTAYYLVGMIPEQNHWRKGQAWAEIRAYHGRQS